MDNILFFHKNEIMPSKGGISKATYNLSNNFSQHGHKVWFVAAKRQFEEESFENQLYLPNAENLCCQPNIDYIINIIAEFKISIVINQCPIYPVSVELLSKVRDLSGVKIISCFHNSILTPLYNFAYQKEYILKKRHLNFVFKCLDTQLAQKVLVGLYKVKHRCEYRRVIYNSDAVVLLNDGLVTELEDLTGLRESNKLYSIPNACCSSENFPPVSKKNTIIWVGTFDIATKRPDIMIKTWGNIAKKHPDWTLKMLGDGKDLYEMKEYTSLYKVKNISFEGRVDPTPFYQEASIIAVTSTHESFSLVTVEALQNRCIPIVINSFPAASLIIKDGINGVLIDPFNIEMFEQAIIRLMNDAQKIKELSSQHSLTMSYFDSKKIYENWIELIEKIYN